MFFSRFSFLIRFFFFIYLLFLGQLTSCLGAQGCGTVNVTCPASTKCDISSCNISSGDCISSPVDCDDNDACTIDTCSLTLGCVNTPLICPSSTDFCVESLQCFNGTFSFYYLTFTYLLIVFSHFFFYFFSSIF